MKSLERLILVLEGDTDTDAEELTALTAQLRWRLLELDVESVESVREGEVPLGAKPIDVVSVGAIVVMLSTAAVPAVVRLMEGWLQRPVLRIKVTIGGDSLELTNASKADKRDLTQAFLDRHTTP
ncbi:MAG TPA: hypothetical protein VJ010_06045 [Actinomycetota bacterium]|nr:hypothetical protein [Actinomycetota bacterium]